VAFGQGACKISLVLYADVLVIPFAFLTAPHMSVIVVRGIFLALAGYKGIEIELVHVYGL
jgi:hypothetical protein